MQQFDFEKVTLRGLARLCPDKHCSAVQEETRLNPTTYPSVGGWEVQWLRPRALDPHPDCSS